MRQMPPTPWLSMIARQTYMVGLMGGGFAGGAVGGGGFGGAPGGLNTAASLAKRTDELRGTAATVLVMASTVTFPRALIQMFAVSQRVHTLILMSSADMPSPQSATRTSSVSSTSALSASCAEGVISCSSRRLLVVPHTDLRSRVTTAVTASVVHGTPSAWT